MKTTEIKNSKSGEGSLEAKALKLFNAGGSHKRSNESNETSDSESFSSKFFSDDSNIKSPHCDSLEKAITFIKTDLVEGFDKCTIGKPLFVRLEPISNFVDNVSTLSYKIKKQNVDEGLNIISFLLAREQEIDDVLKWNENVFDFFPRFKTKLKNEG